LRAENVTRAIGLLAPDVVDVSSGVERATGIKDHDAVRAFVHAAHSSQVGERDAR
jgi:phosphoribosylanthranilate isomerase